MGYSIMCSDYGNSMWRTLLTTIEPGVIPTASGALFKGWRRKYPIKDICFYVLVGCALAVSLSSVVYHRVPEDYQWIVFLLLGYYSPEILDALDLIKAQDIRDFVADKIRSKQ